MWLQSCRLHQRVTRAVILFFMCCYCIKYQDGGCHVCLISLLLLPMKKIIKFSKIWLTGTDHVARFTSMSLSSDRVVCVMYNTSCTSYTSYSIGMGPEHSIWLRESGLTNAAEYVQDCLDS